jgi:hypothetical protein
MIVCVENNDDDDYGGDNDEKILKVKVTIAKLQDKRLI